MFDTHCHLNFKAFKKNIDEVIRRAREVGVRYILIPGTDVKTSKQAVEIAEKNDDIFAAVGIHPHHAFKLITNYQLSITNKHTELKEDLLSVTNEIEEIEKLLSNPKVLAVGEVGMDRHVYENTKYEQYAIDENFLEIQRSLFMAQIDLAIKFEKSLILHNREAKADLVKILAEKWHPKLSGRTILHCCEPDQELLNLAKKYHIFIGVDGDLTYSKVKQEFIKTVPLEMLVLETDSPFLLPEPLKSAKKYPNEPANIKYVASLVAELKSLKEEVVITQTTKNAREVFQLDQSSP